MSSSNIIGNIFEIKGDVKTWNSIEVLFPHDLYERIRVIFAKNNCGSIITKIEDDRITSVGDYRRVLKKFEEGQVVIFYLKRRNTEFHAFVKLPE